MLFLSSKGLYFCKLQLIYYDQRNFKTFFKFIKVNLIFKKNLLNSVAQDFHGPISITIRITRR